MRRNSPLRKSSSHRGGRKRTLPEAMGPLGSVLGLPLQTNIMAIAGSKAERMLFFLQSFSSSFAHVDRAKPKRCRRC